MQRISIGKDRALALYASGWWKEKSAREIALIQLITLELICPWEVFHEAVEEAAGFPVWTHQFADDDFITKIYAHIEVKGEQ